MQLIIILIFVLFFAIAIRSFVDSKKVKQTVAKADDALIKIDAILNEKFDVLAKMIDLVKNYAKSEEETSFTAIEIYEGLSIAEKAEANHDMDESFRKINEIAERYPELKASEDFRVLRQEITDVENHLQAAKRAYNYNVSKYNKTLTADTAKGVASNKTLTKKELFTAEDQKKEDVKIDE